MKLKVLLFPSLVVIIIVLMIWVVYPAYSNGLDGLKEELKELEVEKEKLADISSKIENVSSLSSQIEADSEEKSVLFKYLPESAKEEEIIDNLNYLSGKEDVSVYDLGVSRVKTTEVIPGTITLGEAEGLIPPVSDFPASGLPEVPWPTASKLEVNISVTGKYDSIKNMLNKIYGLGRFNQVSNIEIKKSTETDKGMGDNLEFSAVLSFNFLKKVSNLSNLSNAIFSSKSFDTQIISDIENQKSTDILNLEVGPTGKSNPFFP